MSKITIEIEYRANANPVDVEQLAAATSVALVQATKGAMYDLTPTVRVVSGRNTGHYPVKA